MNINMFLRENSNRPYYVWLVNIINCYIYIKKRFAITIYLIICWTKLGFLQRNIMKAQGGRDDSLCGVFSDVIICTLESVSDCRPYYEIKLLPWQRYFVNDDHRIQSQMLNRFGSSVTFSQSNELILVCSPYTCLHVVIIFYSYENHYI